MICNNGSFVRNPFGLYTYSGGSWIQTESGAIAALFKGNFCDGKNVLYLYCPIQ